jgi:transposase
MDMGSQCEMSVEQRREVVLMMLRREEPIAVLARRYNVSETTLHRWREDFLAGGQAALTDKRSKGEVQAASKIQALERELAERDRVIGELTIANRILKKTADGLL